MSSASRASSTAKKVEWYHLDRVAIAKRICLDPAAVKLKAALNNNNNNTSNNNNNYTSSNTSPVSPPLKSAKSSGVVGSTVGNVSGSNAGNINPGNNSNTSGGGNTINNTSTPVKKTSTAFDIHRLLAPRPAIVKDTFVAGSNNSSTTTTSSRGHGNVEPSKGIFSILYTAPASGASNNSCSTTKLPTIPNFLSSSAGSRQFTALQQKRRRKAARLTLAEQQKQEHQEKELTQCKRFLDEESIIVNGATSVGSSCGSSSRSSSSGVSSDFDETDTASTSTSCSNMKVATAGSRGGESSSSEEDEDEESSSAPVVTSAYSLASKAGKGAATSSSDGGSGSNNNNLSSLGILNNLVMVDGGSASVVGKGSMMMASKAGRLSETSRIVNGKIIAHLNKNGSSVGVGHTKAMHSAGNENVSHGVGKTKVEACATSARCSGGGSKHHANSNGSSSSKHSSASSTTSGSTDNDRDTDNSFSEFPTDLDFMGMPDKGKRRTDRYDSSESSDSGVATLSPSTSDSPELNSTCDFTSEHLDVGNLISASRSSSASSYPTSSSSKSSSSSSASSSSSSGTSLSSSSSSSTCMPQIQGEPSTATVSTTSSTEATLPSRSSSSTGSDTNLLATNPPVQETLSLCMWEGCTCSTEASHNILEHIQTKHVATQIKTVGYFCLWEGCKVFNKRSSSLSWLERHVLSHGGSKPFKCIFPGCGLSFSSQSTLERHVNSHIATNGTTSGAQGSSTMGNKKLDASPAKSSRRKKARMRKHRVNVGQRVDYFDKRIMEVIKHWLSQSADQYWTDVHDCTFKAEVMGKRVTEDCEREILVRWYPRFVYPDEWVPESKFTEVKLVPLRRVPSDKLPLLYPTIFPPPRQGKAQRKRKAKPTIPPPSPSTTPAPSEGASSLTTIPPSPNLSPTALHSLMETETTFMNSSRSSIRSSSSSSSSSTSVWSNSSATTTSSASTAPPLSENHHRASASASSSTMMMDTSGNSGSEHDDEDKWQNKKRRNCDCPSALLGNDTATEFEPSHWALEVLYENMQVYPS